MKIMLIIGITILITLTCSVYGATNYVSLNGNHIAPFTNWADAATSIQEAIDVVGDNGVVLVSNGIYTLTKQIEIANGITLRGPGDSEEAVIDGRGETRCVYMSNAVLENVTVTGGYEVGNGEGSVIVPDEYWAGNGAGVAAFDSIVSGCEIVGNRIYADWDVQVYGGGISATRSTITNCSIYHNIARGAFHFSLAGGLGVACFESTMVDCDIWGNIGYAEMNRGAVYAELGSLIRRCRIYDNIGNGVGGVYSVDSTIDESLIQSNEYGGLSLVGGMIVDSDIVNNVGETSEYILIGASLNQVGGASIESAGTVDRCLVRDNAGAYAGVHVRTGGLVRNSEITRNIAMGTDYSGVCAGGAYIFGDGIIESCTIANNRDINGDGIGGVSVDGIGDYLENVLIKNNIIYGNGSHNTSENLSGANVIHNCIEGWADLSEGNINVDPQFVSEEDLRISEMSLCIDVGTNQSWMTGALDIEQKPRILYDMVDMGAYEHFEGIKMTSIDVFDAVITNTWTALTGAEYQLQATGNLLTTNWTDVGVPQTAIGSLLSQAVPLSTDTQCFYRVVLTEWPAGE